MGDDGQPGTGIDRRTAIKRGAAAAGVIRPVPAKDEDTSSSGGGVSTISIEFSACLPADLAASCV